MDQEIWKLVLEYLATKERSGSDNAEFKLLEQRINDWAGNDPDRLQQLEEAYSIWNATATAPEDDSWQQSYSVIKQQIAPVKPKKIKMINWWPVAAAATFFGALLYFAFTVQQTSPTPSNAQVWSTRKAGPGKVVNIILPDSSQIWLNAGSSISFPQNLKHAAVRMVKLEGEAFFKVKRDPAHPFIVKSLNIQTRVLGTSFNIRAWKNYRPEVTVLTGKVAVSMDSAGTQSAPIHLLPHQKGIYDLKSALLIRENVENAEAYTDWRTGKMHFENAPMEDVFQTISRKYGIKIITDKSLSDCELNAKFDNISIQEVMRTLQLTFDVHYTINKQTIYIKGGKCN